MKKTTEKTTGERCTGKDGENGGGSRSGGRDDGKLVERRRKSCENDELKDAQSALNCVSWKAHR